MGREEECAGLSFETRVNTMNDTLNQARSSLNCCTCTRTNMGIHAQASTCANKPVSKTTDTHAESLRQHRKTPIQLNFSILFFPSLSYISFFFFSFASHDLRNGVVNHQNNKFISDGDVRAFS